jgi:hypothetical protein
VTLPEEASNVKRRLFPFCPFTPDREASASPIETLSFGGGRLNYPPHEASIERRQSCELKTRIREKKWMTSLVYSCKLAGLELNTLGIPGNLSRNITRFFEPGVAADGTNRASIP